MNPAALLLFCCSYTTMTSSTIYPDIQPEPDVPNAPIQAENGENNAGNSPPKKKVAFLTGTKMFNMIFPIVEAQEG